MISGKIKALKDQRKQVLEEKKAVARAQKCAAAEDALETQSQEPQHRRLGRGSHHESCCAKGKS
jgi:hypothetical protein